MQIKKDKKIRSSDLELGLKITSFEIKRAKIDVSRFSRRICVFGVEINILGKFHVSCITIGVDNFFDFFELLTLPYG